MLTGTALAYGFSAIAMLLVFQAPRGDAARAAMFWLLGSLGGASWQSLPVAAVVTAAGIAYLLTKARQLNALAMGDETATTLGVAVNRLRTHLFIVTAAMTGVLVAVSGAVGFVGLMLPHLTRMVVGADHRKVLALAPLAGASLPGLGRRGRAHAGGAGGTAARRHHGRARRAVLRLPHAPQGLRLRGSLMRVELDDVTVRDIVDGISFSADR